MHVFSKNFVEGNKLLVTVAVIFFVIPIKFRGSEEFVSVGSGEVKRTG